MVEAVALVAAVVVAFVLANLVASRVYGVSLLCRLGVHRWHKVVVGQGRDARYVVKCKACEVLKDEA